MTTRSHSPHYENAREALRLSDDQVELLADLIAGRLADGGISREPLVCVRDVAAYLSVEASWVYEHAAELGARRLGSGPKAPLRFSLAEVDARLASCYPGRKSSEPESASAKASRPRRRRAPGSVPNLLPIRGSNPASEAA